MKHSKTLIAAAVAALIAGTAVAGEGEKDKSKHGASFNSLDTNRDGRISKAEAAADATIMFTTADANGDGYLDSAEYKAAHKGDKTMSPQSTEPRSEEHTSVLQSP